MTDIELFKVLRPHVLRVSGCPEILLAAQNKQAPEGSYGSIQVRYREDDVGQGIINYKDVPGDQVEIDVRPQLAVTCVVEFFRDNAKKYAENLKQMNRREDVTWPLFKDGISIRNMGNTMDLTALQSSNYEERARIEFVLWMEASSKYVVNNIRQVWVNAQNEKGDDLGRAHVVI